MSQASLAETAFRSAPARAAAAAREPGARLRQIRLAVFFMAVLAINYTLSRPSPVDILFLSVLLLSINPTQIVTRQALFLFAILFAWTLSLYMSSINLIDNPAVVFQLTAITFVILLGVSACLVSSFWDQRGFETFLKVYIVGTCIAATLGILGFVLDIDELLWDGRAKGLLDDPNMYGAFLLPGIIGSLYLLPRSRRKALFAGALALLLVGLLLSFSRAAITSLMVWASLYLVFQNRNNLLKAGLYVLFIGMAVALIAIIGYFSLDNFAEKFADRLTLAKDYDLGHGGRYSRYSLSIPFILSNPLGMGLFEIDRYFDEPIHNIWISSFLNYGWLAGVAWTLLMVLSCQVAYFNLRATRNELCIVIFLCWISVVSCAFLHQAERWRHLWLFTGVLWGLNAGAMKTGRDKPA